MRSMGRVLTGDGKLRTPKFEHALDFFFFFLIVPLKAREDTIRKQWVEGVKVKENED